MRLGMSKEDLLNTLQSLEDKLQAIRDNRNNTTASSVARDKIANQLKNVKNKIENKIEKEKEINGPLSEYGYDYYDCDHSKYAVDANGNYYDYYDYYDYDHSKYAVDINGDCYKSKYGKYDKYDKYDDEQYKKDRHKKELEIERAKKEELLRKAEIEQEKTAARVVKYFIEVGLGNLVTRDQIEGMTKKGLTYKVIVSLIYETNGYCKLNTLLETLLFSCLCLFGQKWKTGIG